MQSHHALATRVARLTTLVFLAGTLTAGWRDVARADENTGIPLLAKLSPRQSQPARVLERERLTNAVARFNADANQFNADCSSVKEDDASAVQTCTNRLTALQAAKRDLIAKITSYNERVRETALPHATITWVASMDVRGAVFAIGSDGQRRRLTGSARHFEVGERIITGHAGRLSLLLPDETVFTVGPDGDIVLDSYVYSPGVSAPAVDLRKGAVRFVSHNKPTATDRIRIKLAVGTIGIRGTDLQVYLSASGDGYVVLRSGLARIQVDADHRVLKMLPGQVTFFTRAGAFSPVRRLRPNENRPLALQPSALNSGDRSLAR